MGNLARFPEELFVGKGIDLRDFAGTLEVNAPTPVMGVAIRLSPGEFAALPANEMKLPKNVVDVAVNGK